MSRIYVSTRQAEEHRIVIEENGQLVGFEQDIVGWENKKGDIYKAVVTRVEEGLDAAFVDFGEEKNGFLPLKNIAPRLPGASGGKHKVAEGDSILVQIKKDHVSGKGSGLTTGIALAGCYLVLMPNHRQERAFVSKNVSGHERQQTMEALSKLEVPDGMSVILRTAGVGRSLDDLRWDLESYLLKLWRAIESAAEQNRGPILIYRENNLMLRAVRDYFRAGGDEIYCDDPESHAELKNFVTLISPEHAKDVHFHESEGMMIPDIVERQIDAIYEREIKTPLGARVVFDSTEAMFTIDVNSGQMRGQSDIEETALRANMDAADVIARHLRLRDMGGLIVVDFIDMTPDKNRTRLEEHIASLLRRDRARVQWTTLSRFGLMELSRQRLSRPVEESQSVVCKSCHGTGRRRRPESFALRLLGQCRSVLQSGDVGAIVVQAPADTAIYLLNEKRIELRRLEDEYNCEILIAPAADLHPPDFNVRKVPISGRIGVSYQAAVAADEGHAHTLHARIESKTTQLPKAVIDTILPDERQSVGFISKLMRKIAKLFSGDDSDKNARKSDSQNGRRGGNRGKNVKPAKRGVQSASASESDPSKSNGARNKPRTSSRRRTGRRTTKPRGDAISTSAETSKETNGGRKRNGVQSSPIDKQADSPAVDVAEKSDNNVAQNQRDHQQSDLQNGNSMAQPKADSPTASTGGETLPSMNADVQTAKSQNADANGVAESDSAAASIAKDSAATEKARIDSENAASLVQLATEHEVDERTLSGALSAVGCDSAKGDEITAEVKTKLAAYFVRRKARISEMQNAELKMVESASSQPASTALQMTEVREIAVAENATANTPVPVANSDLQQVETKSS